MNWKKWIFLAAAAFWMVMIFSLSHQKAQQSNEISGGITYRAAEAAGKLLGWDDARMEHYGKIWEHPVRKMAHMTEYAVFAVILLGNFSQYGNTEKRRYLWAQLGAVGYAATDEFHQLFIQGRSGQISDVIIDATGACIGLLAVWGILHIWHIVRFVDE